MRSLILAAVLAVAADAWGCSCIKRSPAEHAAAAPLEFVGTVTKIEDRFHYVRRVWTALLYWTGREPADDDPFAYYGHDVTFAVERVVDGPGTRGDTFRVLTGRGGGDCGYEFERGERYLVYAYRGPDDGWRTNICTGTRRTPTAG